MSLALPPAPAPAPAPARPAEDASGLAEAALLVALAPLLELVARPVLRHAAGRSACARLFALATLGTVLQWMQRGRFVLDSHIALAVPSALFVSVSLEDHPPAIYAALLLAQVPVLMAYPLALALARLGLLPLIAAVALALALAPAAPAPVRLRAARGRPRDRPAGSADADGGAGFAGSDDSGDSGDSGARDLAGDSSDSSDASDPGDSGDSNDSGDSDAAGGLEGKRSESEGGAPAARKRRPRTWVRLRGPSPAAARAVW